MHPYIPEIIGEELLNPLQTVELITLQILNEDPQQLQNCNSRIGDVIDTLDYLPNLLIDFLGVVLLKVRLTPELVETVANREDDVVGLILVEQFEEGLFEHLVDLLALVGVLHYHHQ